MSDQLELSSTFIFKKITNIIIYQRFQQISLDGFIYILDISESTDVGQCTLTKKIKL